MMRQESPVWKNVRFGLLLAALAAAGTIPLPALGADRMVIVEEFTNVG